MKTPTTTRLLASAGILVALAGCETIEEEYNEAVGFEYVAMLAPSAGGTGSGKAEVHLNDATNLLCTDLELTTGVAMTAGHILGPGNTAVASLEVPDDNDSQDCDDVSGTVVDAIRANPGAYRVHIAATTGDLTGTLRRE